MTNTKGTVHATQATKRAPFVQVPKERDPRWFDVTLLARTIGLELEVAALADRTKPPGIDVGPDWRESLCRRLQINGPDRRQGKRALTELAEVGLILVGDGRVWILYTRDDVEAARSLVTTSAPAVHQVCTSSTSTLHPLDILSELTPQNDSTHTSLERKKEDIERETRARAREASPPDREMWLDEGGDEPTPYKIGHDWLCRFKLWTPAARRDLVEYIGSRPEHERLAAEPLMRTEWFRHSGTLRHLVEHWEKSYSKSRAPNQRDDRPGLRNTVPVPNETPLVSRLETELAALKSQLRQTPSTEWEHTRLSNQIAELQTRVTRARYAA